MPHSFCKIWVHAIFSTKNRQQLIFADTEQLIYDCIAGELKELGCPVRIINGMPEHVHLLFLQNPNKGVADVIKQIKGFSLHYVNRERVISVQFAWQTGYAAYSVSESQLDKAYHYIKNQKKHHQYKTFEEEYNELAELYKAVGKQPDFSQK